MRQLSLAEPKTVKFTPKASGKYLFYCSNQLFLKSHRERGMEALLEVVPQ